MMKHHKQGGASRALALTAGIGLVCAASAYAAYLVAQNNAVNTADTHKSTGQDESARSGHRTQSGSAPSLHMRRSPQRTSQYADCTEHAHRHSQHAGHSSHADHDSGADLPPVSPVDDAGAFFTSEAPESDAPESPNWVV